MFTNFSMFFPDLRVLGIKHRVPALICIPNPLWNFVFWCRISLCSQDVQTGSKFSFSLSQPLRVLELQACTPLHLPNYIFLMNSTQNLNLSFSFFYRKVASEKINSEKIQYQVLCKLSHFHTFIKRKQLQSTASFIRWMTLYWGTLNILFMQLGKI